jgi:hypothetical protein
LQLRKYDLHNRSIYFKAHPLHAKRRNYFVPAGVDREVTHWTLHILSV